MLVHVLDRAGWMRSCCLVMFHEWIVLWITIDSAAAAAKLLKSCPTLCDPRDGSPPGSPVPGILQARTLEWVAISFSNAWKWKVKVKLLSRVRLLATHGLQPTRLLHPWDFPGKSTGVGCYFLLHRLYMYLYSICTAVFDVVQTLSFYNAPFGFESYRADELYLLQGKEHRAFY